MIHCVNVLVADHSSYARLVLSDILNNENTLKVVETAKDGEELLVKARICKPDVIIMDAGLPGNERFRSLKILFETCKIPVVLTGSAVTLNDKLILQAQALGINNFLVLPDNLIHRNLRQLSLDIINEIYKASGKMSAAAFSGKMSIKGVSLKSNRRVKPSHVIVIGASTGGPQAIETIIKTFEKDFNGCILVAQHMPAGFTKTFADRLNTVCSLNVKEGFHGMLLEAGSVIIAPGNKHMIVKPIMGSRDNFRIEFTEDQGDRFDRPSVDILMTSVAEAFGDKAIGIILTGMGQDGARGVEQIAMSGGKTIIQDKETSLIFGMGKAALETGHVHRVLNLIDINPYISSLLNKGALNKIEL